MSGSDEAEGALRRWNIQRDPTEALEAFRNRLIVTLFAQVHWRDIEGECQLLFFLYTGAELQYDDEEDTEAIRDALTSCPLNRLLYYVDCLLRAAAECQKRLLDFAYAGVELALQESPDLNVSLHRKGKRPILCRAGAALLDSRLVDPLLSWLQKESQALAHFETALRERLQGIDHSRQCLDALRKALEEMLREVLGNAKSLENQKDDLGKWLKEKGVHVHVRNLFHTLLAHYERYQNEAVKHGNAWAEAEVDFIIYLTASFMYLLLVAQRNPKAQAGALGTAENDDADGAAGAVS